MHVCCTRTGYINYIIQRTLHIILVSSSLLHACGPKIIISILQHFSFKTHVFTWNKRCKPGIVYIYTLQLKLIGLASGAHNGSDGKKGTFLTAAPLCTPDWHSCRLKCFSKVVAIKVLFCYKN